MLVTNFASGEISEKLAGRVDLQQYYQAAAKILNFEIEPTGGIYRRVGFNRLLELDKQARIIPFIVDKDNSFICVFYAAPEATEANPNPKGKIDIYKYTGGGIEKITGDDTKQLITEYANIDEINEIQYAQDFDRMIFVQKNHAPLMLKYNAITNIFEKGELQFDFSPDIKLDDDYQGTSEGAKDPLFIGKDKDGNATNKEPTAADGAHKKYYVSYGHLFKKDTKGVWHDVDTDEQNNFTSDSDARLTGYTEEKIFQTSGYYPRCVAFFNSRLWFAGGTRECQKVYASKAPSTTEVRYNDFSTYEKYITVEKSLSNGNSIYTFTADVEYIEGAPAFTFKNVSQDFTDGGKKENGKFAELWQSVTDADGTTHPAYKDYYVYNTSYVPAGAHITAITMNSITLDSAIFGFPETKQVNTSNNSVYTVTDNIAAKVFTISKWADPTTPSANDYTFSVVAQNVVTADCSFSFEIASDQNDAIKWLSGGNVLSIGTESGVWTVPAATTALSIQATNDSRNGSDDIQAHKVDNATVYFAQGKHGIREHYYNTETSAFQTNNIALFADHLLRESPAVDFDFETNPYNRIIVTQANGNMATMLYDKNNGIMGWNRIEHGGGAKFTSCATVRGNADSDILFQVVKDNGAYFLEMLDPNKAVCIDSWQNITGAITAEDFTGLAIKYTDEARVFIQRADGTEETLTKTEAQTAIENATFILGANDNAFIGYNYTSEVKSLPIVAGDPSGKRRIVNLLLRFNKSYFPILTCDNNNGKIEKEYFFDDEEPFTGYKYIDYPQNSGRDVCVALECSEPKPCNILCIQANLTQ